MITVIYLEGEKTLREHSAERLPTLLQDRARVFWVDLEAPTPDEFRLLEEVFHFHPLAIEDAANPKQRPKVDEYEDHAFFAVDAVTLDLDSMQEETGKPSEREMVRAQQISLFLGAHFLVSVHMEPVDVIHQVRDVCQQNRRILPKGVDFVLYTLLDVLVDGYFPLLDALEERVDALEDRIVENPERNVLEVIFAMKRELMRLKKHIAPLRDVLQTLTTRDFPGIQPETMPYLRDVDDHLFRIYENLDTYRDQMSNLLDAYLSQVSNEMNRVMQKLSAVSIIFLPLTFMTGFFGMNFTKEFWADTNPWLWLVAMIGVAGATYWWFSRRRWV